MLIVSLVSAKPVAVIEYVPDGLPLPTFVFFKLVDSYLTRAGLYEGESVRPVLLPLQDGRVQKAGIFICYDGLFPDVARELTNKGAEFLIQLSSEAWYMVSAAPRQFLNMYRLRAIENGRSVVRAANNGISGWIDSRGFLHDASQMDERKLVIANVAIEKEVTLYSAVGDIIPLSCLFLIFALSIKRWRFSSVRSTEIGSA